MLREYIDHRRKKPGGRMRRLAGRPAALAGACVSAVAVLATGGHGPASAAQPPSPGHSARSTVATTDAGGDVGRWKIAKVGPHAYAVTWASPRRLPYSDAWPEIIADGRRAGLARLSTDRRTVSVTVASATRPSPGDFDVLLGGRALDERADFGRSPRVPYRPPADLKTLTEDPGAPGFHAIATSDYALYPVALPGVPKLAEMVGHVVAAVDATESSPLVLFLHGVHEPCYRPREDATPRTVPLTTAPNAWKCPGTSIPVPSYLGYDYVQRLLASQGYVTVSISADAIIDAGNAADGGAAARAALIRCHLEQWVQFVADGERRADLGKVILVGHSRGGEGANRASLNLPAGAGYKVAGQVLLAPTDFGFQSAPYTPTVTVLPYCDGDVTDLQGQNFTDDARDLTGGPIAFHSSILVMGANHNFFNTEWTPGLSAGPSWDDRHRPGDRPCGLDDPARLSAAQQRTVAKAYIAGAVHLFADDDQDVLPMFDGSPVSVPSTGNADVRSHAIGGGLQTRRPGIEATVGDVGGDAATLRLCVGVSGVARTSACEPDVASEQAPHWPPRSFQGVPRRKDFEMRWTGRDQAARIDFTDPWDLSRDSHLDLRTIVDPALGRARLDIRLIDGSGASAMVAPEGGGALLALPGDRYVPPKRWAQTLRVPLDEVTGIDLSEVEAVELISRNPVGRIWILDMSAAPTGGVTEPSGRLPLISLRNARQDEGDGPGDATLPIRYHVSGDLAVDATVNISTIEYLSSSGRHDRPDEVVIPAHTTDGVLDISYTPNTVADYGGHRRIYVYADATYGIQTNRYLATARIADDDPVPTLTVEPVATRVAEGQPAEWRIRLSAPLGFDADLVGWAVRAVAGEQLTVGELPAAFRRRHFYPRVPPLDTPLPASRMQIWKRIPAGRTSIVLDLPTRRTRSDDRRRWVSIRFRIFGIPGSRASTVAVVEPKR
jgi:hypothetical protein